MTAIGAWADALAWLFIGYFALHGAACIVLNLLALRAIRGERLPPHLDATPGSSGGLEPGVALIVPVRDGAATVVATVRALLRLDYPDFELIVVNDGSSDDTLGALQRAFDLHRFPEAYRIVLPVQPVRALYRSPGHPRLRVVDKAPGGRADAVNAGINAAHHGLVAIVDAAAVLQRDSLRRLARPFMQDARVIAAGGTLRVADGAGLRQGRLEDGVDRPAGWASRLQAVECLRGQPFGRLGWSQLNALPLIPGAFGLFRRAAIVDTGGLVAGSTGEDMALALRLHRRQRLAGRDYRIVVVPDALAWVPAPESTAALRQQRIRWQRGLMDSLVAQAGLLGHPRAGAVGWLAYPCLLLFEGLGPLVELLGYAVMAGLALGGQIGGAVFGAFVLMALGLGTLSSVGALLLEEIACRGEPRPGRLLRLLAAAVVDNLGHRQRVAAWRLRGLWQWARAHGGAAGSGDKGMPGTAGGGYNARSRPSPPRSTP